MFQYYDVIVIGGGHAGCEAASSAANLGSSVLLVTMNLQTIGQMSCNPAMGGIAKGQIIKEIDALGGYSGIISDLTTVQFRMLNRSKGPAMWSPRSQNDKYQFAKTWRTTLESIQKIDFYQDSISALIIHKNRVEGIKTTSGFAISSKSVIITTGTFLNGKIHIGEKQTTGGRIAENSATGITEQLINYGFESGRLKTGTPPRIDGRSINYEKMDIQLGDEEVTGFSFLSTTKIPAQKQLPCFITYTNEAVHEILKKGFEKSPMFSGRIQGVGPRYCPSIEDKINRFADRDRHQLFVEPEGFDTAEVYLNGFSTSLPENIQYEAIHKINGLENAKFFRPGYAIEYDFFFPTQLKHTLETKSIENLFFAGQINGTTGYEEAACQGLMAGINAYLKVNDLQPFILSRNEAYIGVLIDDLISKGTEEPYRMFTSRAEFRTLLRQDNADLRLTEMSYKIGLASEERYLKIVEKKLAVSAIKKILNEVSVHPEEINPMLEKLESSKITEKQRVIKILLRPDVTIVELAKLPQLEKLLCSYNKETLEQAEIQIKYERYIEKEEEMAKRLSQMEEAVIPESFQYEKIPALGTEAIQKLKKIRPRTLGQAGRISGVNPSDVQILMVYMGR